VCLALAPAAAARAEVLNMADPANTTIYTYDTLTRQTSAFASSGPNPVTITYDYQDNMVYVAGNNSTGATITQYHPNFFLNSRSGHLARSA